MFEFHVHFKVIAVQFIVQFLGNSRSVSHNVFYLLAGHIMVNLSIKNSTSTDILSHKINEFHQRNIILLVIEPHIRIKFIIDLSTVVQKTERFGGL